MQAVDDGTCVGREEWCPVYWTLPCLPQLAGNTVEGRRYPGTHPLARIREARGLADAV